LAGRFNFETDARSLGAELLRLRLALSLQPRGFGTVARGLLFGVGLHPNPIAARSASRDASINSIRLTRSATSVSRAVPDLLFGSDRVGAGPVGLRARLAFLAALVLDRDLLLLPRDLDRLRLRDL
jgi:hypothetical protein